MVQSDFFTEEHSPKLENAKRVRVLVPLPVDKAYDYAVPEAMAVQAGDYVTVPVGKRELVGVVWGEGSHTAPKNLKSILDVHDLPPLPVYHREFIDWLAQYTLSARGAVLKMTLSMSKVFEPEPVVTGYRAKNVTLKNGKKPKLTEQQQSVMDVLDKTSHAMRVAEIADQAACSASVVKGLVKKGLAEIVDITSSPPCRFPDIDAGKTDLSGAQAEAAAFISTYMKTRDHKALLLDGVTGAGKTEVYFEAVAKALEQGRQALILLPEIALSNAFIDRFKKRFGCSPALWHSALSNAQRRRTWRGVAMGETRVVVGARSALFLPYADLGVIITDEEHDPAYKQEEGVIYHARDMAVVRAHLQHIPIMLVSATPSLETVHNIREGRYAHVKLPARYGGAHMPDIKLIDLREDKPERQHFLSPTLKQAVADTLAEGDQAMLFLNRRGYAPLTLCRTCGHRMSCPRCSTWLVEHKHTGKLHCHHCGYFTAPPQHCPACEDTDSFAVCGPGVERILEEVKAAYPQARVAVLSSDTAGNNEVLKKTLSDIRDGKVDIIIGTQIIAKGHHFPHLTCVGVVDADLGLNGGDLRAAERVYQLLHQVAGRAGRAEKKGTVYLQTFVPEHKIMQALAAEARDAFLDIELSEREQAHMPPFSRLAGVVVSGRDQSLASDVAKALGKSAPQGENVFTLGPAPAPLAKLRGKYRFRLLVCAHKNVNIQKTISAWIEGIKVPSKIRITTDIDPQNFL